MRIVAVREQTIELSSATRNSSISFDAMTASAIAVHTDRTKAGKPLVGLAFDSVGRYAGCVVVEVTRVSPMRITRTTFAPDLGPIALEMQVQDGQTFKTTTKAKLRAVTKPGDALTP